MAIYCPNKNCPLISMGGLDSVKQHGRHVRCIQCGSFMVTKSGKTKNGPKG